MASLKATITESAILLPWLNELKQYAAVPDDSRDQMLSNLLRTAILKVQEYADAALVECSVTQTTHLIDGTVVWLYLGGGVVEGVKNQDGENLPFLAKFDAIFLASPHTGDVRVTYLTVPNPGDIQRLKPVVFRYATALFDGKDSSELGNILNEALC